MTEGAINKVLYTVDQRADTTAAEKKTARDNIGAVGAEDIQEITDQRYKLLQSPVLQTFSANAVIDRLEQDAQGVTTVHCSYLGAATASSDGLMPAADKAKLDGIQAGAEVNVQSDWLQNDSSADDYIKNRPTIPVVPPLKELVAGSGVTMVESEYAVTISTAAGTVVDANYVHTDNNFTNADKAKLDGIQAGADITWTQDSQGTAVVTEADTLDINRDTHRVQMGAGSTTADLGFVAPPMASAPQEDMFLSMAARNTVPTWTTAPVAHTVGFIDVVL